MASKIIFFELNEVPFRIIDWYCSKHPDSFLARTLPKCSQFETRAEDTNLSPWITWPSVHRGVSNKDHRINEMGQNLTDTNQKFPPIWEILTRHGISTAVCLSFHSYPIPKGKTAYTFYLPDAFATGNECIPSYVSTFQTFNLNMTRQSARNVSRKIAWKELWPALFNAPKLGVRIQTLFNIILQLVSEKLKPARRARRRTYQSLLAFDIFFKHLKQAQPSFSTFFTNHMASSMHRYWSAAFPEKFPSGHSDSSWIRSYENEIDFAMSKFDLMFQALSQFVDQNPEYQLWVVSSMGQSAVVNEQTSTQIFMKDLLRFMSRLGLEKSDWTAKPAMMPQINLQVENVKSADILRAKLKKFKINQKSIGFTEQTSGLFSISLPQSYPRTNPAYVTLEDREIPFSELGLEIGDIEDQSVTTAYHVPEGVLIIYDHANLAVKSSRETMATTDIAPKILNTFSLDVPEYMRKQKKRV